MASPARVVAQDADPIESGFRRCDYCPPDDNLWPETEFKAAGTAYQGNICDACFQERHPARYADCSGCGRRMRTRRREGAPMCRSCRRGESVVRCGACGTGPKGELMHRTPDGVRCSRCYQARRKAA